MVGFRLHALHDDHDCGELGIQNLDTADTFRIPTLDTAGEQDLLKLSLPRSRSSAERGRRGLG